MQFSHSQFASSLYVYSLQQILSLLSIENLSRSEETLVIANDRRTSIDLFSLNFMFHFPYILVHTFP